MDSQGDSNRELSLTAQNNKSSDRLYEEIKSTATDDSEPQARCEALSIYNEPDQSKVK